jgi:hypothetical protein
MADLLPSDPLSQVVFVHSYLQLVFQDSCFSIYNPSTLRVRDTILTFGQPGFADDIVALIGQGLSSVSLDGEDSISLIFKTGAVLSVARGGTGPEAWQYNSLGGPIVVEQNA